MSPIYVPGKVTLAKEFTWNETVWNPSMLQTDLWFDAADASTIIESGGDVSQWNDKSGNGDNAIWTGSKPTYELGAFNGKDSIYFDGTDLLQISGFNLDLSPFTIMFAGEGILSSAGTNNIPRLYFNSSSISYTNLNIIIWPENNTKRLLSWSFDGVNSHTVHRNASIVGTVTQAAVSGLVNDYGIGRAGSNYSDGRFCEYIVLKRNATTTERQKLEGYLAHKWGLTANLPNDHPYKLVGPTP
jgi:hypothetical protein